MDGSHAVIALSTESPRHAIAQSRLLGQRCCKARQWG
jgi:hypothetical protein